MEKAGWKPCTNVPQFAYMLDGRGGERIFLDAPGGQIRTHDARWVNRPNVHIVAYWYWPTTIKQMQEQLGAIRETYAELCGSLFPEGHP